MTIESFHYFYAIAEGMTYMEASEEFNISQSSLSKAIFRLEDDLGIKLFDRSGHKVQLTQAGIQLYSDLKEVIPGYKRMLRNIELLRKNRKVSICIIPSLTSLGLSTTLQNYGQLHPEILLNVMSTADVDEMAGDLEVKRIDFAIMHEPDSLPGHWRNRFLHDDNFIAILPKNHIFADKKEISFRELVNDQFILNAWGGTILKRMTCISGIEPVNVTTVTATRENILMQVCAQRGIALYYASDLGFFNLEEVAALRINDVPCPPWVIVSNIRLTEEHKMLEDYIMSKMNTVKMPDI